MLLNESPAQIQKESDEPKALAWRDLFFHGAEAMISPEIFHGIIFLTMVFKLHLMGSYRSQRPFGEWQKGLIYYFIHNYLGSCL